MGRVNKNISFNTNDPFESKMLEYSLRLPNFSGFMKRLFQNYLQSNHTDFQHVQLDHQSQSLAKGE